ncbi:MAG: hypothetical protein IJN74_01430 [Clostridia bacterium]|nr:hypothetical protein [Clostridia bacterium]
MLMQYGIPLLITGFLALFAVLLFRSLHGSTEASVEIIISGDEGAEQLENTVMIAKQAAERYFKNASVYIRGGEGAYIDALCQRYHVLRKE